MLFAFIALLILISPSYGMAQTSPIRYRASDYPLRYYKTTTKEYQIDSVNIKIIQVKRLIKKSENTRYSIEPHTCRAWLRTERNGNTIKQIYFNDIDASGWKYGLFTPQIQPMQDHFIVCKIGDYNGRLFVIDKAGHIADYPGGNFILTGDNKYFITEHSSDCDDTITVFNIAEAKKLFTTDIKGVIYQWYQDDSRIYYRTSIEIIPNKTWAESIDTTYTLDFTKQQLILMLDSLKNDTAVKIPYYLDVKKLNDCECDK